MTKSQSDLLRQIAALEAVEFCVGHNEGTYGAAECCRMTGCGDPRFGNRRIYETVGGKRRATGPDPEDMPGRMQYFRPAGLLASRRELAELRREHAAAAYE